MPVPRTVAEFGDLVVRSQLIGRTPFEDYLNRLAATGAEVLDPQSLASMAVRDGMLTMFQANLLLQGKWKNFFLGGKYKVLEHLGSGGMGAVFLCEHRHMRRRVAVKLLPPDQNDPDRVARFRREAQAIAMLDHPNIVRAFDIDHEAGLHFLVMEYIDGASFQWIVDSRGPLTPHRAANYLAQAALALQHAFEMGLVHRDVKPSNLMLDWSGTVKLLDLGLARFFRGQENLQSSGVGIGDGGKAVLGTADYLAPEQAKHTNVDVRADIYSLGAVAYFLLTGHPPFDGGNIATKLIRHQTEVPAPAHEVVSGVPVGLSQVVARMLEKDPAKRPQTPAKVIGELRPWVTDVTPPTEDEMPPCQFALNRDPSSRGQNSTMASVSKSSRALLLKTMAMS